MVTEKAVVHSTDKDPRLMARDGVVTTLDTNNGFPPAILLDGTIGSNGLA